MAKPTLTQAQAAALNANGTNILVSAAAGSGKTFTLTQRIIKKITDENADISRILVVTFTRAAASELRSRISSALTDKIAEHPENTHLQNQLLLLGSADISTIDAFLSRPIRENFDKLGLPVSMRLAEESETSAIKKSIMEDVMNSMFAVYGVCDNCELSDIDLSTPYTDLLSILQNTVKDASDTVPYLMKLHSKLITSSRGVELLSDFSARLYSDAKAMREHIQDSNEGYDFLETAEGRIIFDRLGDIINHSISFCDMAIEQTESDPVLCDKFLRTFEDDKNHLICTLEHLNDGYSALKNYVTGLSDTKFGRMSAEQKTPLSENLRACRIDIREAISDFAKKHLMYDEHDIISAYEKTAQMTEVLYTVMSAYDRKLTEEKESLGIYEFSDMPRLMMRLLTNSDGSPSDTARALSEHYDEVYIDEYQDVNEIQDMIFSLLSPNARFMVGDVKQSIYRFRDAEPTFFTHYRSSFPEYDPNSPPHDAGCTVYMSENFRSDENVIKFSNLVCSPIFRACGKSISYTKGDDLVFSKKCPEGYTSPLVSVDLFGKGSTEDIERILPYANICTPDSNQPRADGLTEEAVCVANKIADLIRNGKKANGSKISPCDIAILVRSKEHASDIIQALKRLNIKYLVASKSELLSGQKMRLLIDLCDIIDNPRNDVPLCNVLTSHAMPDTLRLDIGETVTLRHNADKRLSLYDAVLLCSENKTDKLSEKCARIIKKLSELRALSIKLPADKLLRLIAADADLSQIADGDEYKYMYDCACKYTRSFWNGLSGFIAYFKQLSENGRTSGEVAKVDDAVNIITAHYSKGLQYNTCFLYNLGKEFNDGDYSASVIYDKDLCVGMHIPQKPAGAVNHIKAPSIIHDAVVADMKSKDRQEEMRILYVAMTRAEERLCISGTVSGNTTLSGFARKLSLYGISDMSISDRKSYLPWVLGGIFLDRSHPPCYTLNIHQTTGTTDLAKPFVGVGASDIPKSITQTEREYAALAAFPPSQKREEIILSSVPSKVAASKVSPSMLEDSVFSDIPVQSLFSDGESIEDMERAENKQTLKNKIELLRSQPPKFDSLLDVNRKPTAAERGTATHAFLQYWDLNNARENGIENEISRLVRDGFISERTAKMLNVRSLRRCLDSELTDMILSAKQVRREFKFGIMQSADNFTRDAELASLVSDRNIFVQGSIDLLIENHDGSVCLCDYKTDSVTPEEKNDLSALRSRFNLMYAQQLKQYSKAIEYIFGKKTAKTFILSVPLGKLIRMD